MKTVFLDTVGLIALWNRSDQWHAAAMPVFLALQRARSRLITTTYVLMECGNEAARRPYRPDVIRMREELGLAGDLYEPTPADLDAAVIRALEARTEAISPPFGD